MLREEDVENHKREVKKQKLLRHEQIHLENIPNCDTYERSYMHRDYVSHVLVTKTQFLITASIDGIIKFWKKTEDGIEFVKGFKTHLGPIEDLAVTEAGDELVSISKKDKSVKVFDVRNFDMINMFSLEFEPKCIEWINNSSVYNENLIIADSQSSNIYVFDAKQSSSSPIYVMHDIHVAPVCQMRFNPHYKVVLSIDSDGVYKYWTYSRSSHRVSLTLSKRKGETNVETKPIIHNINYSSDGEYFVTTSSDRIVRICKFKNGKQVRQYDESLDKINELQKEFSANEGTELSKRISIEKELEKESLCRENAIFDQSGHFLFIPTAHGVKIMNWRINKHIKTLGTEETNLRPLCLGLFQGIISKRVVRKMNADSLESGVSDPTLYCTAYRKNRFYCFSKRRFEEVESKEDGEEILKDRDIYNELPTREEVIAAREAEKQEKKTIIFDNATIHTTMGDIHLELYPKLTPKTCENFCTLAKNGYYNNHIFHRVIKQFMIQTGDPTGTGSGGESIWEDEFEDEFRLELRHDRPFVLSMANCGPNTNGSQFFITVAPCPFLDNKHTMFGRVVKGMDVCTSISRVKTDPKTDKPYNEVKIINIKVF